MKYRFIAKDKEGKTKTGFVESNDAKGATLLLQSNQLVVISLEQANRGGLSSELSYLWEGVKASELVMLFRQLTTLLEAKVPILVSFRVIEKQVANAYLRRIMKEVGDDIEDGTPLFESLSRHPKVFTPLMVSMIKSGEVSGHLQSSFSYIAGNLEKNYALTSKIKSALTYPGFVLSAAIIVGFLVITFILPNLSSIIREMGSQEIPWYTELLMATGDFFQNYWWVVAGSIIALIGTSYYYVQTPVGKREWDRVKLKLPVIGRLFQYMYISRFSDNFATLLSGGIPIASALQIVASVVGNGEYEQVILSAGDEVKKGGSISTAFRKRPDLFPTIVPQMLEIGEETGKTEDTLKSVTSFYDQETDNMARNMTSLIEPVLIVALGIGVAVMVVGVLLPVYSISSQAMQ
ncbi:MAG: type II secretion system F family protein [Candidatus Moraniibacteriota bacterium]|nr:MAG: type II secretion system F family protein [Candidatus Moranbacteria bacterium]